jgi:abortive infection bacteriophage resistance protein
MHNDFIKGFPNHYNNDFINKHLVIKNHHKNHPQDTYAPAWKTLENFPFGAVFKVYQCILENKIKERISSNFGIKPIQKFEKTFNGLVRVRNRCAHGAILYNYRLPKSIPTIPDIDYIDDKRNNLRVIVQVIEYLLNHISTNRQIEFITDINHILRDFKLNCPEAYTIYIQKSGLDILNENL